MPRTAALGLIVSALLLYSNPIQAQIQQPQFQQQHPQMQQVQMPFEQRRALQLPGTLVVERAGMTVGRVVGGHGPNAIECGSQCTYSYGSEPASMIHLSLRDEGSTTDLRRALEGTMMHWSGACMGYFPACDVRMTADARQRVILTIGKPRLTIRMQGSGTISDGHGPACPSSVRECIREYPPMAQGQQGVSGEWPGPPVVILRDMSNAPRIWTGCDAHSGGVSPECKVTVTMASEVNVKLQVVLRSITIHRIGNGQGQVLTNPAAPGSCNVTQGQGVPQCLMFEQGTDLTLTATDQFTKWTAGPCNGQTSPTCRFTVGANTDVYAQYDVRR